MKWNLSFFKKRDKEANSSPPAAAISKPPPERYAINSLSGRKRKLTRSATICDGSANSTYKSFNSHLYPEEGELLSGDEFNPGKMIEKSRSFDLKVENVHQLRTSDSIMTVCPNCRTSFDICNNNNNESSVSQFSLMRSSDSHHSISQHVPPQSLHHSNQRRNSHSMSDSGIFEVLNQSDTSQNFTLMDLPEMGNETDSESVSIELPIFSNKPNQLPKPPQNKRSQAIFSSDKSESEAENLSGRPKRRRLKKRKELQSARQFSTKPCPAFQQAPNTSWVQKHVFQANEFQLPSMYPNTMTPNNELPQYNPPKPLDQIIFSNNRLPYTPSAFSASKGQPEMNLRSPIEASTVYQKLQRVNTASKPPTRMMTAQEKIMRERSLEDIRFSLRDQMDQLKRDKIEMEAKFRATQRQQMQTLRNENSTKNDYHRELVLRALAVAHQKLETQLDRLQASYDSLIAMKYRKMYQDLAVKSTDFTR